MRRTAALATLVIALVGAASAHAHSGVTVSGSTISYFAPDAGSESSALLSHNGASIDISDPTAFGGVTPYDDCVPISSSHVSCPSTGIAVVSAALGPEDDAVTSELALATTLSGASGDDTLNGGPGPDRLTGGPGEDELRGNEGNDTLVANDGQLDRITCGGGADSVIADPLDLILDEATGGCESVQRRTPGAATPADDPGADRVAPAVSGLRVSPRAFRVTARRRWAGISWSLSEPASTAFGLQRGFRGRRSGGRCVRGRAARRNACVGYASVRRGFIVPAGAGRNFAELALRQRGRRLPAGRYRLRARATDTAGNRSSLRTTYFRIRR